MELYGSEQRIADLLLIVITILMKSLRGVLLWKFMTLSRGLQIYCS